MFWKNLKQKSFGLLALLALLTFALIGCGSDDPAAPSEPGNFDDVLKTGGEFEVPVPEDEVLDEQTILETVGNEEFFCTTTRYSVVEAPGEFPQFDPNAEVIYPGNLLQGNSLGQATPNPIPVRRGGGVVVMTILNGSTSVSRTIPVVSLGSALILASSTIPSLPNATGVGCSLILN